MAALVITPEIEAAAQRLADATGTTPAEALVEALRREVAALPIRRSETTDAREARLGKADAALKRLQALPWNRSHTSDEIVGYDEAGLPTG